MCENAISIIKMLRPEDVWHPRVGAPPKNRNALKHGRYTRPARERRAVLRDFRRRVKQGAGFGE